MLYRALLVGFMSMFESTLFHKCINVLAAVFMLCAITRTMPSKTKEYNYANILSQIVIILSYMATILLASGNQEASGVDPRQVDTALFSIQLLMTVYLVYVSTNKLTAMVRQSKIDVKVETQIREGSHSNQAIERAFLFFDKDGSGGVNLSEICYVLGLVGIPVTQDERCALLGLAEEVMWGRGTIDGVRQQLESAGVDCRKALRASTLRNLLPRLDLSSCGWDITQETVESALLDMDANSDGEIDWSELAHACGVRYQLKDCSMYALRSKARELEPAVLKAAAGRSRDHLSPDQILEESLDSANPRETTLSLLVRASMQGLSRLSQLDVKHLRKLARDSHVDEATLSSRLTEAANEAAQKELLIDMIDAQRREVTLDVFRRIWLYSNVGDSENLCPQVQTAVTEETSNPIQSAKAEHAASYATPVQDDI